MVMMYIGSSPAFNSRTGCRADDNCRRPDGQGSSQRSRKQHAGLCRHRLTHRATSYLRTTISSMKMASMTLSLVYVSSQSPVRFIPGKRAAL
jgi:hypothetical protein